MKRSEINRLIRENEQFIAGMGFHLPPFAGYTPEEWREKDHSYDEIRERMLGWDVTDYGKGDFHKIGLFLFTLRNGTFGDPHCPKTYAEKLLISEEDQYAPMHFHFLKTEDIINRGGGNLVVELYKSTPEEELDRVSDVTVSTDGRVRVLPAGGHLVLTPGESVTLPPRLYHAFWAEKGTGKVLIGEVSKVNDDCTDNRFYENLGRFPEIEEDEAPYRLLCNEYPSFKEG